PNLVGVPAGRTRMAEWPAAAGEAGRRRDHPTAAPGSMPGLAPPPPPYVRCPTRREHRLRQQTRRVKMAVFRAARQTPPWQRDRVRGRVRSPATPLLTFPRKGGKGPVPAAGDNVRDTRRLSEVVTQKTVGAGRCGRRAGRDARATSSGFFILRGCTKVIASV